MAMRGREQLRIKTLALAGPTVIRNVGKALYAGAERIKVEAQLSITRGAVSGKGHVASAPGQPPNQDTGVLAGNIEAVQTGPLTAEVSSNAPYSAPLEYGTSKMAARPFMRPARDRQAKAVRDLVTAAVKKAINT
jgi:HK97 gp10 family phage protein